MSSLCLSNPFHNQIPLAPLSIRVSSVALHLTLGVRTRSMLIQELMRGPNTTPRGERIQLAESTSFLPRCPRQHNPLMVHLLPAPNQVVELATKLSHPNENRTQLQVAHNAKVSPLHLQFLEVSSAILRIVQPLPDPRALRQT